MIEYHRVRPDHPPAVALLRERHAFYRELYGGDEDGGEPLPVDHFDAPDGCFLVATLDGEPVGCGGWRRVGPLDHPTLHEGDAELMRFFVAGAHRGRGHGRALLVVLERTAAAAGARRMVLETGLPQRAAIGLYTATGYAPVPPFGRYTHSPLARCCAKVLESSVG